MEGEETLTFPRQRGPFLMERRTRAGTRKKQKSQSTGFWMDAAARAAAEAVQLSNLSIKMGLRPRGGRHSHFQSLQLYFRQQRIKGNNDRRNTYRPLGFS